MLIEHYDKLQETSSCGLDQSTESTDGDGCIKAFK